MFIKIKNLFLKFKHLLLALFLVTSIIGVNPVVNTKAYAQSKPDYTFYVENPSIEDAYFNIFNAIAILFGSNKSNDNAPLYKNYINLLKLVFVLSAFFIFASGVLKIYGGGESAAKQALGDYVKYLLIGFSLLFILYSWKASIYITAKNPDNFCLQTATAQDEHYEDVIDNFPGALAFVYTFINQVGLGLSDIVQTLYAPNSTFITTKNYGYLGALKANMKILNLDFDDVSSYDQNDSTSFTAKQDLGNRYGALLSQCILIPFSSCPTGVAWINMIKNSDNIYTELANLYSTNPIICNNTKARDYELKYAGTFIECGKFWDNIKKTTQFWKNALGCEFPDITKGGVSLFNTNLTTPTVSDLQQIALQSALIGQLQKTYANLGLGVNGIGYAATKTRVEFVQSNMAAGAYMSHMLPVIQMVLRALLYAFFPFVFIVVLLPGGLTVLKQYLQSILWVELWTPTAGILNMFLLNYAQGRLAQQYLTSGLTTNNIYYYLSNDSTIAGVAGYLYLAVPALTWLILKGSGYMLGNVTGAIAAGMTKNIQTQAINQDTAEIQKYKEFAEHTPGYVSMAEMSHYEALQKGTLAGAALAGTKSVSLKEQAQGAYAGSYIETAKKAGESIQMFNSIAKHSTQAVSSSSYKTGALQGAESGASIGTSAMNGKIGEYEVLGMDSSFHVIDTALGKITSGAYHISSSGHAKIGNEKGDTTEFERLRSGYREITDVGANDVMSMGAKRQDMIKKYGLQGLNNAHKARQIEKEIKEFQQAEGQLAAMKSMEHGSLSKLIGFEYSKGGTIEGFYFKDKRLRDETIKGEAGQALSRMFGTASLGRAINQIDDKSYKNYLENTIAKDSFSEEISQAAGANLIDKFGKHFDKKSKFSNLYRQLKKDEQKDLKPINLAKDMKKIKKALHFFTFPDPGNPMNEGMGLDLVNDGTNAISNIASILAKSKNLHFTSKDIRDIVAEASNYASSHDKKNLIRTLGREKYPEKQIALATALLSESGNLSGGQKRKLIQTLKNDGFGPKVVKTISDSLEKNGQALNLQEASEKPSKKTNQASTSEKPSKETNQASTLEKFKDSSKMDKLYSMSSIAKALGTAQTDTQIGKGIGAIRNLEKNSDVYVKNAMAEEMANQQTTAAKIAQQGGVNSFVATQTLAARMAAAAQQGETFGKAQQDLQTAGLGKDAAKDILDAFKKGADEAAKKIKDALKDIGNLEEKRNNFESQKQTATKNAEYQKATTGPNAAFDAQTETMSDLGQEAYSAQGEILYAKDTTAFTASAKQAQRAGLEKLFRKKEDMLRKRLQKIFGRQEAEEKARELTMRYFREEGLMDEEGRFVTGKQLKVAEMATNQMRDHVMLGDGSSASLSFGVEGVSGNMSSGLAATYNDSDTFDVGDHLRFDPGVTAAIATGGLLGGESLAIGHSGVKFYKTARGLFDNRLVKREEEEAADAAEKAAKRPGLIKRTVLKTRNTFRAWKLSHGIDETVKDSDVEKNIVKETGKFGLGKSARFAPGLDSALEEAADAAKKAAKRPGLIKRTVLKARKTFRAWKLSRDIDDVVKDSSVAKDIIEEIGRFGAKEASHFVPGLGFTLEEADAVARWSRGDYLGAIMSGVAGVATYFPGIGDVVAFGLDALNLGKDFLFHLF